MIFKSLNHAGFGSSCLEICSSDLNVSTRRWAFEACAMIPGRKFALATRNGLKSDISTPGGSWNFKLI
jgi:hypothetical protein